MKNISFWISLLVFILLMCSCKSKEVVAGRRLQSKHISETAYMNEVAKIDTTKTYQSEQFGESKVIEETIITEEYDKDTGTLTKKTKTERTVRQDTDKVASKDERKGLIEERTDSLEHIADVSNMMESKEDVTEESAGNTFLRTLAKWLVIGIILIIFACYVWNKLNNKLPLSL